MHLDRCDHVVRVSLKPLGENLGSRLPSFHDPAFASESQARQALRRPPPMMLLDLRHQSLAKHRQDCASRQMRCDVEPVGAHNVIHCHSKSIPKEYVTHAACNLNRCNNCCWRDDMQLQKSPSIFLLDDHLQAKPKDQSSKHLIWR